MENKFTLHISAFNDRVRAMNQLKQNDLRLTATEANNLQADILAVLAQAARLSAEVSTGATETTEIRLDGGGFK
jgi:hypothetical protein